MNAEFDVINVILKTKRVILRPWKETDLEDLFEYASVEGVGEMAGWAHHTDINFLKQILDMFIGEKKTFALVFKENNKVIGSVGIEKYGREETLSEFFNIFQQEVPHINLMATSIGGG